MNLTINDLKKNQTTLKSLQDNYLHILKELLFSKHEEFFTQILPIEINNMKQQQAALSSTDNMMGSNSGSKVDSSARTTSALLKNNNPEYNQMKPSQTTIQNTTAVTNFLSPRRPSPSRDFSDVTSGLFKNCGQNN